MLKRKSNNSILIGEGLKIKDKFAVWLLIALISIVGISGCGLMRRPVPPVPEAPPADPRQPYPQTPGPPQQGLTDQNQLVDSINARAESVTGVDSASSIVMGNVAIIGLTITEGVDSGTVKEQVMQEVETLAEINDAMVTADPEIVDSIRSTAEKVAAGRPTAEVFDEIIKIWERLRPQR